MPPRSLAIGAVVLLLAAAGAYWLLWSRPAPVGANLGGQAGARPLVLVFSGDTSGFLIPCGCATNQAGGLLRRATYLDQAAGGADVVYADVGGAPGGDSPYHRLKSASILQGEMKMNVAAHNLGAAEAALGADELRRLRDELQIPFVSANLKGADGQPLADSVRVVERQGKRLAFCGVISKSFAKDGLTIEDPLEAARAVHAQLRGKFDVFIVLAYLPTEELQTFAEKLPEADVVMGGPTRQAIAPKAVGPTTMGAATNKGKFLIRLDCARDRMAWSGFPVEMGPSYADAPAQKEILNQYLKQLAERDFTAEESGFGDPHTNANLPKGYRVAGSDACVRCHQQDGDIWKASKHSHAWETLTAKGMQVDSYCQKCHTTGYGMPEGFVSAKRSPHRVGVGCESCHGPSQEHAANPKRRTAFGKEAKDQCLRCHDPENSPTFNQPAYWAKIKHGEAKATMGEGGK